MAAKGLLRIFDEVIVGSLSCTAPTKLLTTNFCDACGTAIVTYIYQEDNMEENASICGGVFLIHTVVNGKHQYEVVNSLTDEPRCFAKKNDKVLMINNVDTQNLPPDDFAMMLTTDSPMLTLHPASTAKKSVKESDTFMNYDQKNITMFFKQIMVREDFLEEEEEEEETLQNVEDEFSDYEDDSCLGSNMLVVSMTKTSVSVLTGRGCESCPSCNCGGEQGCSANRVVVTAKQHEVTAVSKKCIVKYNENGRFRIQSLHQIAITPEKVKKHLCRTFSTSDITIYYYKTNLTEDMTPNFKGIPVVLNFTDSNNFLKCTKDDARASNEQVTLSIECCDKADLERIYKDDPVTWPFVFYMTNSKSNCRRFESAAHRGWFIYTKNLQNVCMGETTDKLLMEDSFCFFIFKSSSL